MAPPLWGGLANITNILVSFTGKFTDIPGFVSKLTNILVNLLVKLTRTNPKGGAIGAPGPRGSTLVGLPLPLWLWD